MFFWSSVAHASSLMPVQGSTVAPMVDSLYKFLVIVSLISCILVIGGMVYFAYKYRRQGQKSAYIPHGALLEFLWSFIPFVIFMVVFGWGWVVYHHLRTAPEGAFEVHVVGAQWNWNFQYKSGKTSTNELVVPINKPVKLIMSSQDVIHSFFVPAFRTKQDVVPGRYSTLWFEATKLGDFNIFCTEYCGLEHSAMIAKLRVVTEEEFETWLQDNPFKGLSITEIGEKVFGNRCTICHNVTSERKVGPGLLGIYGGQREFENGETLVADDNYLRESILYPANKIVKGYPNAMTAFQGNITEKELSAVIEYLKSLK